MRRALLRRDHSATCYGPALLPGALYGERRRYFHDATLRIVTACAEKRTSGAEKRTSGAEKRTSGAKKRTSGAKKRNCTLGPP